MANEVFFSFSGNQLYWNIVTVYRSLYIASRLVLHLGLGLGLGLGLSLDLHVKT